MTTEAPVYCNGSIDRLRHGETEARGHYVAGQRVLVEIGGLCGDSIWVKDEVTMHVSGECLIAKGIYTKRCRGKPFPHECVKLDKTPEPVDYVAGSVHNS